jgi:hypothetical protein
MRLRGLFFRPPVAPITGGSTSELHQSAADHQRCRTNSLATSSMHDLGGEASARNQAIRPE